MHVIMMTICSFMFVALACVIDKLLNSSFPFQQIPAFNIKCFKIAIRNFLTCLPRPNLSMVTINRYISTFLYSTIIITLFYLPKPPYSILTNAYIDTFMLRCHHNSSEGFLSARLILHNYLINIIVTVKLQ